MVYLVVVTDRLKIVAIPRRFSLNYVMISTNNKIRNESLASTGSLANSKRVFLHFICLARAQTNAAGSRPGFRQKKSKACRKPAQTCRKPGRKPGQKLAMAIIMECDVYHTNLFAAGSPSLSAFFSNFPKYTSSSAVAKRPHDACFASVSS